MYPTLLPRPPYLADFHGSVRVRIRYDNRDLCLQQACGPVELPDSYPVAPLVTFEAISDSGKLLFPIQVWDYESRKGEGAWENYNEDNYPVPQSEKSQPEVEPESSLDIGASSKVETESVMRPDEELDDLEADEDELVVDEDEGVEDDD